MKIKNQTINGGNQQFADIIVNTNSDVNDLDKKFLSLFDDTVDGVEEKIQIIRLLEKIKNEPENETAKDRKLLKKFVDASVGEAGKEMIRTLVENGADYLSFLVGL